MFGFSRDELARIVLGELVIGIPLGGLTMFVFNRLIDDPLARDVGTITGWLLFPVAVIFVLANRPVFFRDLFKRQPVIPVSAVRNCVLEPREHLGVLWRPRILGTGSVKIHGPDCPEDENTLIYRRRRMFALRQPAPKPEPAEPLVGPRLDPLFGLRVPETLRRLAQSKEEDPDWETRDIMENDTAGDEAGPFCDECGRFRSIPKGKTVGECRLEVLSVVKAELRL